MTGYNLAIALSPAYVEAHANRALAYVEKGNYDQAIAECNRALDLKPGYARAYYNRGLAYAAKGTSDKAIADFRKVLDLSSDAALRQLAEHGLSTLGAW
jgi:tetratricopeptide (TPR) repeat protein